MSDALRKSYRSFSYLFMLNWDVLLSFGITALALALGAYFVGL
ncbi:hypothetical protein [Ruegeria arenilitoris]|nr:hypothetical protein [Ruegeria arenilitoris]